MESTPALRPDCQRCAALCCLLAFDRSALFAFDKPAGVPCPHLDRHRCGIHRDREHAGFGGCARYDCHGAGQRVTQELFQGRSWRDHPDLTGPMLEAFLAMREAHEWLWLLEAAAALPLDPDQRRERLRLQDALQADQRPAGLGAALSAFLVSLRGRVPRRLPVLSPGGP
jgi:hypothetical protein